MSAPLPRPAVEDWDFPRSVASVALLVGVAQERGVREPLAGTTVSAESVADPDARVDAHAELAVIRNLVRALGDPLALGVAVGRRYRVTTFGIFGFACLSSPTLRDAVALALNYLDLSFTFCIPRVTVDGGAMRLTLDDSRVPGDVRRFLVERDLTAIHTVMSDLLGAPPGLGELRLRAGEPSEVAPYLEQFGLRPRFAAETNRATFDAAQLDRPLPQANEQTVAICAAQCRKLVADRRGRAGIADDVRRRLVSIGGAPAGIDEVAADLALSTRTLRRRLSEAGTSYRTLLDEVRQVLAEEMLRTGALSISDIAVRLGYAESASFIHAFRRWTGESPSRYAERPGRRQVDEPRDLVGVSTSSSGASSPTSTDSARFQRRSSSSR